MINELPLLDVLVVYDSTYILINNYFLGTAKFWKLDERDPTWTSVDPSGPRELLGGFGRKIVGHPFFPCV